MGLWLVITVRLMSFFVCLGFDFLCTLDEIMLRGSGSYA